ncbi:MAG: LTA synthase family protein [Atopobiaceae bacterium]|nr:LTA synthase family protein [Atopobiaceae bacterium]
MDDVRFEQVSYGSPVWALVPAIALIALVVLAIREERTARTHSGHILPSTVAWTIPHLVILAAAATWYAAGAGSPNIVALAACCAAALCSGCLTLHRSRITPPTPLLLAAIPVLGVLALELCANDRLYTIGPQFWLLELALVATLLFGLWLLSGRRGVAPAIGLAALTLVGTIQHYVLEFRGTAILPSDIFALGTAMSVSGGYTYDLSAGMMLGFAALSLGITCCALLRRSASDAKTSVSPKQPAHLNDATSRTQRSILGSTRMREIAGGAALLVVLVILLTVPSYGKVFGVQMDYWWSKDWYGRQGFLPSFVYCWQDLAVNAPEGYSADAARTTQAELAKAYLEKAGTQERRDASTAQFAQRSPNIIVIQNETFCDLSTLDGLRSDYKGPTFWRSGMPDALARGELAVSVFGGGTCNTEFEFLTNNSLAFLGAVKYPFTMYDLTGVNSIPRQLSAAGYRTVGMHPNIPSNWNRDRAYAQLGFDEFLDENAFIGDEQYHTHTSDWATYDRTLELIRAADEPLFVFDVTMQNHSGYDTGSIPEDELRNYTIDGLSDDDTFQLNEFLACIDESDRAFERLITKLRTLDEPTIVVMYGDHHPWFSTAINDVLFPNEDELTHAERIHNTCYLMWSNYEIAGGIDPETDGGSTSADLLSAMMLDGIGAPLTDFQQALLGARQTVRAVNANGYLDAEGTWHPLADDTSGIALIEYLNFGSQV